MMNILPMVIISIISALLSTMNIWSNNISDIRFHLNDIYMAFLMAGWMIFLYTIYDYKMIQNNNVVLLISLLVIIVTIFLIRSQTLVTDVQYINGMIPHHSMAITTSKKIKEKTNNPEIIKMADDIIRSQQEEINMMNDILEEYI